VVQLFARNIHDSTLPFNIQTMSAKLLLNLVEGIARKTSDVEGKGLPYPSYLQFEIDDVATSPGTVCVCVCVACAGRALLVRILDNFVNKFSSLKKQIPKIVSQPLEDDDAKPGTLQSQKRKRSQARTLASIKDCRVLMKNLVMGLKNIVWGITSCTQTLRARHAATAASTGSPADPHRALIAEECLIFTRLLKNGLKCFGIYSEGPNPSLQEEKDVLQPSPSPSPPPLLGANR
jgi:hypothetical protein